jgi:SAM-dependent methyltransferase
MVAVDLEQRLGTLADFVTAAHWHAVDLHYDTVLATRRISCPLCGHTDTRDGYQVLVSSCQFGGGRLERYQCPDCDLVFGPLKMLDLTPQMLAADYKLLYETYREANSTASEVRAFHSLAPDAGGIYLNWGCGAWSETIEQLRSLGWDVWGYEPSVPPESPFVAGHTDQISALFDGIFSNNVIEHFRDPVAEFREMVSHLRPGGLMTHATGCYQLNFVDTRFHTAFYLGRSVELIAKKAGLEVVAHEIDSDYESVIFRRPD